MVVLWGSLKGNQFGSLEDLRKAATDRRVARAVRRLAQAMREHQLNIRKLGQTAQEASLAMAKLGTMYDHLERKEQ